MTTLLKKLYKPMENLKIANKMMFIYVVGGFIPLLILSFFLIGHTRSILIDQATKEALTNASRLEERLQDIFRITVDVSDGVYLDEQLKTILSTRYRDPFDLIEDFSGYTKMDDYLRLYPELDSIRIYVTNDTLLDDSQIVRVKPIHKESYWYQLAKEQNGKIAYVYRFDDITRDSYMSLVRLIKDFQGNEYGVLVININNRTLRKFTSSEPYEVIGILDGDQIFLSSDDQLEGLALKNKPNIQMLSRLPKTINDYTDDQSQYKVIIDEFETPSSGNKVRLLTLIPVENFLGFANDSIKNSIVLISISVIVALLMVYFLTRKLSNRIEMFRKNLHKVTIGDFELDYDVAESDEIGLLFKDLEVMTNSIKSLIQEVYESGVLKEQLTLHQREVEFKMLTSQIDPHFLYNTLETIRMEAVMNDQNDIAQVVKKLANIMRRKLAVSNDEVSLESELDLLSDYLEIQKFRFRERVSYDIIRNCDTKQLKILPLLLQPVVENAFVHGLERKIGDGKIEITISEKEDFVIIVIKDNGVGISKQDLKLLKDKMKSKIIVSGLSIGLCNVFHRVAIFYQEPYHIDIVSDVGHGTSVIFNLPKSFNMREEGVDV